MKTRVTDQDKGLWKTGNPGCVLCPEEDKVNRLHWKPGSFLRRETVLDGGFHRKHQLRRSQAEPESPATNRHVSREDIQVAKRHTKRDSTSLITREMQIKTTMRYHLILIKMAIIRKSTNNKYWTGVEKRELSYTVVGMQTYKATMENSIEIPLKVRNKTTM